MLTLKIFSGPHAPGQRSELLYTVECHRIQGGSNGTLCIIQRRCGGVQYIAKPAPAILAGRSRLGWELQQDGRTLFGIRGKARFIFGHWNVS